MIISLVLRHLALIVCMWCVVILYVCVDFFCVCLCLFFHRGLDLLQDGDTCPTTAGQEDTEQEPATVDELYDLEHYDSSGEEEGESVTAHRVHDPNSC